MKWMKPVLFMVSGIVVALFFGDKIKSLPIISSLFNKNSGGKADEGKDKK